MISDDFDSLAAFDNGNWNHNSAYHHYLLRRLPPRCQTSLEVGCGAGAFARLVAQRSEKVLALDLSPRMISLAKERSVGYQNIEYIAADGLSFPLPLASYDCVASISTLHHLDLAAALTRLAALVSPGGVLLALDLYRAASVTDYLISALALPVNLSLRVWHGDVRPKPELVRKAWSAHRCHERILTFAQVSRICASVLPGARLRRHLLWHYSIVWTRENE